MAKKKNAPALRGGDNNQPTITKSYAVRDKWLDKAKDNLVEFKSVDGEISDLMVNGEPAGGGGGTATVTFTNSSNSKDFNIMLSYISSETGMVYADGVTLSAGETKNVTVPLGPAGCYAQFGGRGDFPENGTATGGVRYDGGDVYITGNGTLTVS